MIANVWNLLIVPKEFFREHRDSKLARFAIATILAVELVYLVGLMLVFRAASQTSGPGFAAALRESVSPVELLPMLIGLSLFWWGILAVVIHFFVHSRAEHARYLRTFSLVGLAALVEVPAVLLGVFDVFVHFESTAFIDPSGAVRVLETARFGRGAGVLSFWVFVTGWKGYIWRDGLVGMYGVSGDRASLAALVAVLLSLVPIVGVAVYL